MGQASHFSGAGSGLIKERKTQKAERELPQDWQALHPTPFFIREMVAFTI